MDHVAVSVTDATFDVEVLQASLPVLVDFWAPWCGPCRMFSPVVEAFAKSQIGKVKVVKVNVDEAPEISSRYAVGSIPTVALFVRGQKVATKVGMLNPGQLSQLCAGQV